MVCSIWFMLILLSEKQHHVCFEQPHSCIINNRLFVVNNILVDLLFYLLYSVSCIRKEAYDVYQIIKINIG
nr:MAG TPA: hypothetical protein [Caudoviricetes sp.]